MDYRISWAQNREDFLIDGFFPDVEQGHYVDVGAAHPTEYSVTKLFYDRGWSGINVEPLPDQVALLLSERPRDVTLAVGLAAEPGTARFRRYAGTGLSTTSAAVIAKHDAEHTPLTDDFEDVEIQVTTLTEVLQSHPLPHIHFLKVDVEGSEYEVLTGNDWDRFRPELICVETDHLVRDWRPLLADARYEQVFHDGLNAYFLAAESLHRADRFRYPKAVLDAPVLVTPEVAREVESLTAEVVELGARHDELAAEVDGLRVHSEVIQRERDEARANNDELRNVKRGLEAEIEVLRAEAADREATLTSETKLRLAYVEREAQLSSRYAEQSQYLAEVLSSQSWRLTKPLRRAGEIARARAPRKVVGWARRRRSRQVTQPELPVPGHDLSADGALMLDALTAAIERRDRRR